MQSSEEPRKGAGRPSLLTPAQQAEADRNRILTKLEHGKTEAPAPAGKRTRRMAWGAAGALALVIGGGAAFNLAGDQPADKPAAPVQLAAAGAPPARASASASPAVPAAAEPVPAAVIHDEPAPAGAGAGTGAVAGTVAARPAPDELRKALEEGTAGKAASTVKLDKSDKPSSDALRDALEEGTAAKKTAPDKPLAKLAAKPPAQKVKVAAKPAPKAAPARRKPAEPTPHDSDLALLSALVAHTQPARASDHKRTLKQELAQCRLLKGSKARDCREEACLGQERSVAACR